MFVMKGYSRYQINRYDCSICLQHGVEHKVIDIPGPPTTKQSCWGPDLPTTLRTCTGCGATDGPWVSTDLVGGGW